MIFGISYRLASGSMVAGFALISLTTVNAYGQDTGSIDENPEDASYSEEFFYQEVPSIITATHLQQSKAQTPASVTVIDRAMIDASGFVEIADLLRLVPGFQVGYVSGRSLVVTSHGQTSEYPSRLLVLVDGRSTYLPLLSNVDWTMLGVAIDDIERIEVIRGPNAAAYGSNAFIGTVNIITRQPFLDRGNYVSIRNGDLGMRNVVLRHGGDVKGMDYRITGNYRIGDGFDDQDDEYDLAGLSFRGTLSLTPSDQVDIQLGHNTGHTGAGGVGTVINPERPRNVDSQFQLVKLRRQLSIDSDLSVQFYHNYYNQDDSFTMDALLSNILGVTPAAILAKYGSPDQKIDYAAEYGDMDRYDLELQHASVLSSNHRLVWGAGLRHDSMSSEFLLGKSGAVTESSERLFLNSEVTTSKSTTLNFGMMIEKGDIVETQYSPRLGFNWAVNPRHILRASISTAHRTPALLDNNWNYAARFADGTVLDQRWLVDEELKSEKIKSLEIGYLAEFPEQHISFETKWFHEEIDDVLTNALDLAYTEDKYDGQTWRLRNDGYLDINGFEGQVMYRPTQNKFIAFQYAYADAESQLLHRLNPDAYIDRFDYTPSYTTSLLASYRFPDGFNASVGRYRVTQMEWAGSGNEVPTYNRTDLRLAQALSMAGGNGEISFVLQNVTDDYPEFRKENLFGTRAYIQFKWHQSLAK